MFVPVGWRRQAALYGKEERLFYWCLNAHPYITRNSRYG